MVRALLQIPLGVKLLAANGVLLAAAAAVGAWFGRVGFLSAEPTLLVLLGIIVSGLFGINWILVTIALGPVKELEQAAARVSRGDPDVRVLPSPVADRSLQRLIGTFNRMVDSLGRVQSARDRLARDLLEAGERDRKTLAEELLAGPAQTLSTTLLLLRRNGDPDPSVGTAADSVRLALEELRRVSAALHPPELDDLGLATALRALVRTRLESRGIQAQVKVEGTEGGVPDDVRLGAFRLIQEAVEIGARIPLLDRVSIWLRKDGPFLLVHVALTGLPPEITPQGLMDVRERELGSGLHRMVERARLLGGELRVQDGSERELEILARLPLEGAPPALPVAHLPLATPAAVG